MWIDLCPGCWETQHLGENPAMQLAIGQEIAILSQPAMAAQTIIKLLDPEMNLDVDALFS